MNNKLIFSTGLLLATMMFSSDAMAFGKNHANHDKERTPILLKHKAAKYLDLSDVQQDKIRDVYEQAKSAASSDKEQLKALHYQWKELVSADTLDENALLDVANQQAQIKARLRVNGAKTKKALGAILNDEQKEKLQHLMKKRKHKRM